MDELATAAETPADAVALPGRQGPSGWSRREIAWVCALFAMVVCAGFWRLGTPTLTNDEAATWAIAGHGLGGLVEVLRHSGGDRGAALYYLVAYGWMRLFGTTEFAIRSLSVLCAAATMVPFHAVARMVTRRRAAYASGALLALSAFMLDFARDGRAYALATLLVVVTVWRFQRAWIDQRPRDWVLFVVVAVAAAYTHWFCILVVIALYASLLGWVHGRRAARGARLAAVAIALATAPIALFVAFGSDSSVGWIAPLNTDELRALVVSFTGNAALVPQLVVVGLATLGFGAAWSSRGTLTVPPVVVTWFVVPVGLAITGSLFTPALVARYLIVALPGLALLVGTGAARIARQQAVATALAVALVVVLGSAGLRGIWSTSRGGEDWRDVVHHVATRASPSDAIVVYPATAVSAFGYYARSESAFRDRAGADWPPRRWSARFTRAITNDSVLRTHLAPRTGVWLVVRAPHGDTVTRAVRDAPVLRRLRRTLADEYREVRVEAPWSTADTVYIVRYLGPVTP
jgi:mannosyltransferase